MKKLLYFAFLSVFTFFGGASAETYSMRWHNTDGTVNQTTTCNAGDDVILPTAPTKYGYTFIGWYKNYIPIEYLDGDTKYQYIDTGITPTINVKIDISVKTDTLSEIGILCDDWLAKHPFLMFFQNKARWHLCASGSMDSTETINPDAIYNIEVENGKLKINNNLYTSSPLSNFSTDKKLRIFCKTNLNGSGNMKIYYAKIYDYNNTLVRDMIPVLDGTGTPCMYDRVTNEFFYNAGTGNFTAGPIINQ